jgi:hypothetical protein
MEISFRQKDQWHAAPSTASPRNAFLSQVEAVPRWAWLVTSGVAVLVIAFIIAFSTVHTCSPDDSIEGASVGCRKTLHLEGNTAAQPPASAMPGPPSPPAASPLDNLQLTGRFYRNGSSLLFEWSGSTIR